MKKYIYWALTIIIALPFTLFGGMKAIGAEEMVNNMTQIHYSKLMVHFIGISEIIIVAGLFFSKYRLWSLIAFLLILAGAVGSHIGAGQGLQSIVIPSVLSIMVLIAIFIEAKEKNY